MCTDLGALRADAEELKLVIEISEAGLFTDLVFQLMDGAGSFHRFDGAAAGANQVVAMLSWDEKGEIGSAFVKAEPTNDRVFCESLEEPENGCLVALLGESLGRSEFR